MAIKINIQPTAEDLAGKSHWWGFPDLPEICEWPCNEDGDLLTFICQISLEDISELDSENRLPHKGMIWFFADLDYFLGDLDAPCGGTGEWEPGTFKVIYSEDCSDLLTHEYYWEDGEPAVLPAEEMTFEAASETDFGNILTALKSIRFAKTFSSSSRPDCHSAYFLCFRLWTASSFFHHPLNFSSQQLTTSLRGPDFVFG